MKFKNSNKIIFSILFLFYQITTHSQNINDDIEKNQ